jgi:hypothetical protein
MVAGSGRAQPSVCADHAVAVTSLCDEPNS